MIECPNCGESRDRAAQPCPRCGYLARWVEVDDRSEPTPLRICPHCGTPNPVDREVCEHCAKPATPETPTPADFDWPAIDEPGPPEPPPVAPSPESAATPGEPETPTKERRTPVAAVVAAAALVLLLVVWALTQGGGDDSAAPTLPATSSTSAVETSPIDTYRAELAAVAARAQELADRAVGASDEWDATEGGLEGQARTDFFLTTRAEFESVRAELGRLEQAVEALEPPDALRGAGHQAVVSAVEDMRSATKGLIDGINQPAGVTELRLQSREDLLGALAALQSSVSAVDS